MAKLISNPEIHCNKTARERDAPTTVNSGVLVVRASCPLVNPLTGFDITPEKKAMLSMLKEELLDIIDLEIREQATAQNQARLPA